MRSDNPNEYGSESKDGSGVISRSQRHNESSHRRARVQRPRRRPMGAVGVRPKKTPMFEGEDGSIETVYEDDRSQSSLDRDGFGGVEKRSESSSKMVNLRIGPSLPRKWKHTRKIWLKT